MRFTFVFVLLVSALIVRGDPGAGECPNPKISLTPDDINQIMRPEDCVALGGNCCNWAGEGWNDGVGAWQDPNEMIGYSVQCRGCYNRTNIYDPVAKQHVLKFD